MGHLETYPECYIPDETYIPLKWDFSNFDDVLDDLKTETGRKKALEIAREGQKVYMDYYQSIEKQHEFVEHLISQIENC